MIRLVGVSSKGNLVTIDIKSRTYGFDLVYSSKNDEVIDSLDTKISFKDAISHVQKVLLDEKFGL